MNIYLVKRTDDIGVDEYTGFVCVAASAKDARSMHPDQKRQFAWESGNDFGGGWVPYMYKSDLIVKKVGTTSIKRAKVIFTDFRGA